MLGVEIMIDAPLVMTNKCELCGILLVDGAPNIQHVEVREVFRGNDETTYKRPDDEPAIRIELLSYPYHVSCWDKHVSKLRRFNINIEVFDYSLVQKALHI